MEPLLDVSLKRFEDWEVAEQTARLYELIRGVNDSLFRKWATFRVSKIKQ